MTDTPDDAPLDIDLLMTIDPLKLGEQDITTIIQYHRNIRATRVAGQGRKSTPAAKPPANVAALLARKPVGIGRRGY